MVLHCPKDTYTPLTYPFISHREAAEEVWQVQITGEARPKPERAGDVPAEQQSLWHSLMGRSLMELPIELCSIRTELVTLMSKESLCWQGCWQPLSTCHYQHAGWNRYNVYFIVMFLPFNVAILFRKYCTLLSLKLYWNARCILQDVKYVAILFHDKRNFTGFFICVSKRKDSSALSVAIFCFVVWNILQCKKEHSLGFILQITVHHKVSWAWKLQQVSQHIND